MKVAFLTEMGFNGKIPIDHPNMRTEFAWMYALDAYHYNINQYTTVKDYDWIMLILPKGGTNLNSEGVRFNNDPNRFAHLYEKPLISELKKNNKRVAYIQEGPCWYVNDFSVLDQFNFYNQLTECDAIFAHNNHDIRWYEGLFPGIPITNIPTLMIEELVQKNSPHADEKTIIGGNFCRWYGGFQSYIIASEFEVPIYVQTSHATQPGEESVPNLTIMPRYMWSDWMRVLSNFKYAVHLMPTIAAGTFSLNCAYYGIPCIGNMNVDTQRLCFPDLSVDPEDIKSAKTKALKLKLDKNFYKECSNLAKFHYKKYYGLDIWRKKMYGFLEKYL